MSNRPDAPIVPAAHLHCPDRSPKRISSDEPLRGPGQCCSHGARPAIQPQEGEPVPQHVARVDNAAALIAISPRKERELCRRIARAETARQRNRAQHRHERSMYTKVAAVVFAARKKGVELAPEEIVRRAKRLDTRRVHQVRPTFVPKLTGGVRVAWAYDVEGRAVQQIAIWQLQASATMPSWQYALGGRSTRDLVEDVLADLSDGACWLLVADIEHCYPSFDAARLAAALPIPTSLARSALMGKRRGAIPETIPGSRPRDYARAEVTWRIDLRRCGTLKNVTEWARETRRGIPVPGPVAISRRGTELPPATATCQGSAFAPLATSVGLGDLDLLMPEGVNLRAWSDNLIVTARTRRQAERAREVLVGALRQSPLGRLRFRYAVIRRRDWGTNILGFHIRVKKSGTTFSPAPYSWARVNKKLSEAARTDLIARDQGLTRMFQTARGWWNYFGTDPSVYQRLKLILDDNWYLVQFVLWNAEPEVNQRPPPRIRYRKEVFPELSGHRQSQRQTLSPKVRLWRDVFLEVTSVQPRRQQILPHRVRRREDVFPDST